MSVPATQTSVGDIVEAVVLKGDLGKLTPEERVRYYSQVCQSIGVNPLTRPLEFITLSGKVTLYAKRDCADQLRKINGISITIVSAKDDDGMFIVHARAVDKNGKEDEDYGVVALPDTMKGEARANAILKAITKAKRRVTLSICGLGFLDETEVEDVRAATIRRPQVPASNPMLAAPSEYTDQVDHLVNGVNGTDEARVIHSDEYIEKWHAIIEQATDAQQLRDAWNNDADTRKSITWGNGSFSALQTRVGNAIKSLEEMD